MNYTCDKVKELMSPCIDGELSEEESELFFAHLNECAECKKEYEKLKATVAIIRSSALSPKDDLSAAVLSSIRSGRRRNKFVRWGSTIAACFVLAVCISAFGVIELMHKSADHAMEDSANFSAYDATNGYGDQKKCDIDPSRALESNTEGNNYYNYSADSDVKCSKSDSVKDECEVECEVKEEAVVGLNPSIDMFASDSYSDERIKKYKETYAPDFESPVGCVIVTECDLPEISSAKLISFDSNYETFVVDFTEFTFSKLTSNLAENDVVELSSTVGADDSISFILYVILK